MTRNTKPRNDLSAEFVRSLLNYDPETGVLTWKDGSGPSEYKSGAGYIYIRVSGRSRLAHRLAWLIVTGASPEGDIDHINRDPTDNRWANLREATRTQNNANAKPHDDNKSGFKGVYWKKTAKRWAAMAGHKHIGYFDTPEAAHAAYLDRAEEIYGKFARSS